jgi:uncharacterized protein (UPF0303 family)
MQTPEPEHIPDFDPDSAEPQSEELLAAAIAGIEDQVAELQFDRFTAADALALGLRLVELGTARNLPIAIDIRRGDHMVFHVALDGATYDNDLWAAAKSRTALRYAEPSLLVGLRAGEGPRTIPCTIRRAMPPTAVRFRCMCAVWGRWPW